MSLQVALSKFKSLKPQEQRNIVQEAKSLAEEKGMDDGSALCAVMAQKGL
jgi:hypothetical protein